MLFNKKYKLRITELESQLENEKDVVAKKVAYITELKHDLDVGSAENIKVITLLESKVVLLNRANEILSEQRRLDIELITMQSEKLAKGDNTTSMAILHEKVSGLEKKNQLLKEENISLYDNTNRLDRENRVLTKMLPAKSKGKNHKVELAKSLEKKKPKRKYVRSGKFVKHIRIV